MAAAPIEPTVGMQPRAPGVYFEFEPRSTPAARRRSDIAGFAGVVFTEVARQVQKIAPDCELAAAAVRCDGLGDFYDNFGVPPANGYLDAAVRGFFANGGRTCYVAPIFKKRPRPDEKQTESPSRPDREGEALLPTGFSLSEKDFFGPRDDRKGGALGMLAAIDAVSLIAAPDAERATQIGRAHV